MSGIRTKYRLLLFAVALLVAPCRSAMVMAQQKTPAPAEFIEWLPIPDSDRQMKSPVVEKDAGAEILLWRVHVVDEYVTGGLQRNLYNYLRMKVFNQDGKEKAGVVDLPYGDSSNILDVSGRTIKPDGTIIELDRKSVYKRDLVRAGGRKEKVVSFAMPGVEAGAILEYRWKLSRHDNRFRYLRLEFAREFPIQNITYFMKPLSSEWVSSDQMYILPFNCQTSPLQQDREDREGWVHTTIANVPAFRDELYAPSDPNVQPWVLLYYRPSGSKDPQKYWNNEAKERYEAFKRLLKSDSEQKAAATRAVESAKNDDEKIAALTAYLRQQVKGIFDPDVTDAIRREFIKKLPNDRDRTSTEIFKSKMALPDEMNVAFAALAAQVGLDVRQVLVANRNEATVDITVLPESYFVDDVALGVRAGDSWKIFKVNSRNLGPGMLDYDEQGMAAIVTDPKSATILRAPVASPETSVQKRDATLKLSSEGALSGKVEESYTGYEAERYRSVLESKSAAQREEWFKDRIIKSFPDIAISELKIENVNDPAKPLAISYTMDAPQFAQVTGKRILFQPNAFRRSQAAIFSTSERRYPVHFPYAWKETDMIRIELPAGYNLENAENPGGINWGDAGGYLITMSTKKTGTATELITSREFTFGSKGIIAFPASAYPVLKRAFDEVQLRDTHTIALREN